MTGMVGVIAHDRRTPVASAEADALAATYIALRGPGEPYRAAAGDFARLVKIDTDCADRPGIERSQLGWAAATGVAHLADSLIGIDLRDIDGQFALARYDARTDIVEVASDPFGLHALYLAERDGKTYFSTSALTLATHLGARPNLLALSMLLACGTQHGSITNWEGIERAAPATVLTFAPDGLQRSTYWRLEIDDAVARLGFHEAVDYAIDLLSGTFRRYYAGRPCLWVDLTGGFDTRLLALLLRHAGIPFHANTVGAPRSRDVRFGRQVARVAGWDWTHFRVPRNWYEIAPSLMPAALSWADGRLAAIPLTHVLWTQQQKSRSHRLSLAGGGGEVFRGHAWRQEFLGVGHAKRIDIDRLIRLTLVDQEVLALLAGTLARDVHEYLRTLMLAQTAPYASSLDATQLDVLLANRKPIWDGIYSSATGGHVTGGLPFLSKPAFTTGFSIHFSHRVRRHLVRAMIARLDPRIAAVPTTLGGPTMPWRFANTHLYARHYAGMGLHYLAKLNQKTLRWNLPGPAVQEDERILAGRHAVLAHEHLSPETMRSMLFYKDNAVPDLIGRAALCDFNDWDLLGRIMTVELLLRATSVS